MPKKDLIRPKEVAGEGLIQYILQVRRLAVSEDHVGVFLEGREVTQDLEPKRCSS
jgi:hypothetical protein